MKQYLCLRRLAQVCSSAVQYGRMVKLLLCATEPRAARAHGGRDGRQMNAAIIRGEWGKIFS